MRAFFAIDLDKTNRDLIHRVVKLLSETPQGKDIRWTKEDHWHVTLRFLGEIKHSQLLSLIPNVKRAVSKLPPFQMDLGAVSLFPSHHNARVVVINIGYSPMMQRLFEAVETCVDEAGFDPVLRPSRPHLTLARLRERQKPKFDLDLSHMHASSRVDQVVLYQSISEKSGVRYEAIEKIPLGVR